MKSLAQTLTISLALFAIMTGGPDAAEAKAHTRENVKQACEKNGGIFNDLQNGDYECLLPDGRHLYCVGFLTMCEFIDEVKTGDNPTGDVSSGNSATTVAPKPRQLIRRGD